MPQGRRPGGIQSEVLGLDTPFQHWNTHAYMHMSEHVSISLPAHMSVHILACTFLHPQFAGRMPLAFPCTHMHIDLFVSVPEIHFFSCCCCLRVLGESFLCGSVGSTGPRGEDNRAAFRLHSFFLRCDIDVSGSGLMNSLNVLKSRIALSGSDSSTPKYILNGLSLFEYCLRPEKRAEMDASIIRKRLKHTLALLDPGLSEA